MCDSLKETKLKPDEQLVSFDVKSLYTNVPVKEAIEYCADLLFKKFDPIIKGDSSVYERYMDYIYKRKTDWGS